jgi:adenine-specific DNA-methyltransferase
MSDFTDDIQQVPSTTPDFKTDLAKKLQELVPEAVADGKIDTQKLKELLDSDSSDDSERFGLFWPGKKRAMRAAQEPTTATLKPAKSESKDWDTTENIFIEGDNLETLKILQKYYHNKIKMIYIDPPYNTGKDFVYPDNFKEGLSSYLEFTKQIDEDGRKLSTNSDTDGRFHSNWLNMIYPRLKLARNLLTDDGIIFMSIDDHEQDNLKKVGNEIFGEDNLLGVIPTIMNLKGNQDAFGFAETHEYFLVYARNKSKCEFGRLYLTEEELDSWQEDEHGLYKVADNLRATGVNAPRSRRPNLWYPIFLDEGERIYVTSDNKPISIDHETVWPINPDGEELSWYWGKPTLMDSLHNLIIKRTENGTQFYRKQRPWSGNIPTKKPKSVFFKPEYSTSSATIKLKDLMGRKVFEAPKPIPFLIDLLQLGTNKDSLVLDFFSGSGSLAHATMELNAIDNGARKHIQVQLPEPTDDKSEAAKAGYKTIADLSIDRIKKAGKRIETIYSSKLGEREVPLDTGFKVFKLADSNFTKWRSGSDTNKDALQQHLLDIRESSNDAASEDDLLTEVLLKQGISLTTKHTYDEVDGLSIWTVGDNVIVAYLNERIKPTLDQLRAVAAKEPAKFIILEDAFVGDDELKTNLVQICKTNKIELWTV